MNPNGDQESRFKSEYGNKTYEFGSFRLDAIQRLLFRDGELIHLPPKSFELLALFVEYPNQVIEKEKLLREVWPEAFVEDANLSVHISSLRKVLEREMATLMVILKLRSKLSQKLATDFAQMSR